MLDGVLSGASIKLRPGGCLFLYGPMMVDGVISPQSNVNFDAKLKEKNPEFGLRDITYIESGCNKLENLKLAERKFVESSNNYLLCIQKS